MKAHQAIFSILRQKFSSHDDQEMIREYIRQNPNFRVIIYIIPIALFIIGCLIHYQRGYYYIDLPTTCADGADDAYISFRYGWNFVNHGILSWNESGYRRTEGFTNPLWVFISAIWALLGRKEWLYPLMAASSIALSSGLLLVLIKHIYQENQRVSLSIIGLIFISITPSIWQHTTSGLESAVFGFGLATLAYLVLYPYNASKPPQYLFVLIIILGFLRSDAFIYLSIILIGAIIARSKSWKILLVGTLLSTLVLLVWRQITFGEWLPNTAIAKVNFSIFERSKMGLSSLLAIFGSSGFLILLLLGLAGLVFSQRRVLLGGAFIAVAWMAFYVYIGGDIYLERHLIGLFILTAAFSGPLWTNSNRFARSLLIVSMILGIGISIQRGQGRFDYLQSKPNDAWVMLGKEMAEERSSYGVIITSAAGKIPFYAGGDFIDLLGLNDPYLATIERSRFIPGHSAGSDSAALDLALTHQSKLYSFFSFLDTNLLREPDDIRHWTDNRQNQNAVQNRVTQMQWEEMLSTNDPYKWSIISQPIYHTEIY